jgi:hypothetical protein
MLMKTRTPSVDFFYVEPHQVEMDKRLVNWGKSQFSGFGGGMSPMFRQVKPSQQWDAIETRIPVDTHDAMLIAKGVAALPEFHALALNWCYVLKSSPAKGMKLLSTNARGLEAFIRDGRQMLINRKV